MNQNKLVSVIIPALNEEKLIEKSLISVKKQNYQPIEIIVVDNGSCDRTGEIAKKYANRVPYLPEKGSAKARNYGAKFAQGEYLMFLDADTELEKNAIQRAVKFLNKGYVGGRTAVSYQKKDQKIKIFEFLQNFALIKAGFFTGPFLYTTREMFQKGKGWNEKIEFGCEIDLMKKLSKFGELKSDLNSVAKTSARRHIQNKYYFYVMSAGILVLLGIKNLPYPPVKENEKKELSFLLGGLVNLINKNHFKDLAKNYKKYLKNLRV